MKSKKLITFLFLIILISGLQGNGLNASEKNFNPGPFPESQFLEVDNINYHYRLWEPAEEIRGKVLLLHGFAGSTYSWRNNVKDLKNAGYQVIALDLPGFGYTDRVKGLNHSQLLQAERIWNLLAKLESEEIIEQNKDWHLIGHSYGGGTAAATAYYNQSRVNSLILIAGALNVEERFDTVLLEIEPLQQLAKPLIRNILFSEPVFARLLAFIYGENILDHDLEMLIKPLQIPGTEDVLIDIASTFQDLPESKFTDINLPILLIWGEEDKSISTPPEEGQRLYDIHDNAKLVYIEKASHFPMESHPDRVNSILIDWLNTK